MKNYYIDSGGVLQADSSTTLSNTNTSEEHKMNRDTILREQENYEEGARLGKSFEHIDPEAACIGAISPGRKKEIEEALERVRIKNLEESVRLVAEDKDRLLTGNLKEDINNFLFVRLPPSTTISQMEELAMSIHSLIVNTVRHL